MNPQRRGEAKMRAALIVGAFLALSACRTSPAPSPTLTQIHETASKHTYRTVDGQALAAYVFPPSARMADDSTSAILLFHGGGWSSGSPEWTFGEARHFANLGIVAISVQYRLSRPAYGRVEAWQEHVTPIDSLADVCAAFSWVRDHARELRVDPRRVAGFGVSAGGHLVASAATVGCPSTAAAAGDAGPDALLLWSPALDLAEDAYFKGMLQGRAAAAEYSPAEH